MPESAFVPGLELAGRFYREAVAPLLAQARPGLPHAAALIGAGSEVLGFDTARSTDHGWGPRLQVFLRAGDRRRQADDLSALLARRLPTVFDGWSTNFTRPPGGSDVLTAVRAGPISHRVEVTDLDSWFAGRLGFDPRRGVAVEDWLATPTQLFAEATGGAVYADELGELTAARAALAWYPDDVWRYVLAGQWQRVGQEEPFVGRCGEVGDDLGSAVLTARLVRDLMRLCLLAARHWPPYAKWLGSAFGRLPVAAELAPDLAAALAATDWPGREAALCRAYRRVAELTNSLRLAEPMDPGVRQFHDRPLRVLGAQRFADALLAAVADPAVRALPPVGAVDQFIDSTDVLSHPARARSAALAVLTGTA